MALGCMCTVAACRESCSCYSARFGVQELCHRRSIRSSVTLLQQLAEFRQDHADGHKPHRLACCNARSLFAVDLHRRNESAPRNTSTGDAYGICLQLLRTDAHEAVKMVGVGRSSVTLRLLRDFAREMLNAFTRVTHYLFKT